MNEELTPQKERFLREVEQKLLHRELDARLLEDGLIHVKWNEKPLCSVDRDGIVRFRPTDITGPEVDRQLRTVIQTAGYVKEYKCFLKRTAFLQRYICDVTGSFNDLHFMLQFFQPPRKRIKLFRCINTICCFDGAKLFSPMVDRALGNTQFLTECQDGFAVLVTFDYFGFEFG